MGKNNKDAKKLQEVITAKTIDSLNKGESKKATKAESKKTSKDEAIVVGKLKDKKSQKATAPAPVKSKKEKKEKKESTPRELKYIYPADCKNSLDKKKFRATCRAQVKAYEKKLEGLKEGTKEYKKVKAEFNDYKKEIGLRA